MQSKITQKCQAGVDKNGVDENGVNSKPLYLSSFCFLQISPGQTPSFPNAATRPTSILFRGLQTDVTHQFSLGSPMAIMELIFLDCFTLVHNSAAWQGRLLRRQDVSRICTQLRKNQRSRTKAGDWLDQILLTQMRQEPVRNTHPQSTQTPKIEKSKQMNIPKVFGAEQRS